ncbi:MAG: 50S ribosome-binding GTPase [Clostridiales bacterium]|nr:50S ribosome-binding GTPase [Clostridiales bacterium]
MKNSMLDSVIKELNADKSKIISDKDIVLENIEQIKQQKVNIMFVGATGVGKSSTINAIFNTEIAKVGYSVNPETASIQKYEIDNMILWDTPGFGDSPEKDQRYAYEIVNALKAKDDKGQLLIDEVVVLIDGSTRDMKTSYEVMEKIIVPFIGEPKRIILAINQCDMALKGRYWNYERNQPEQQLLAFLDEKVLSVKKRVLESTGVLTQPIYYSALYKYNISKLLLTMIRGISENKRFLFADSLNKNPEIWEKNDKLDKYNVGIQKEIKGSLTKALDGAAKGAVAGATVGGLIPVIGPVVGATIGAALGFLGGLEN